MSPHPSIIKQADVRRKTDYSRYNRLPAACKVVTDSQDENNNFQQVDTFSFCRALFYRHDSTLKQKYRYVNKFFVFFFVFSQFLAECNYYFTKAFCSTVKCYWRVSARQRTAEGRQCRVIAHTRRHQLSASTRRDDGRWGLVPAHAAATSPNICRCPPLPCTDTATMSTFPPNRWCRALSKVRRPG